jgi:hypothetical protein
LRRVAVSPSLLVSGLVSVLVSRSGSDGFGVEMFIV